MMNTTVHLPVPEIIEETVFQHSFTQKSKREDQNLLRPPKLRWRQHHEPNCNRSFTLVSDITTTHAQAVSFLGTRLGQLSKTYNDSLNETYFEQCFVNISKLGEGSFGEVFKVQCKEDGLCYAVKMSKQFYRSEQYRQERLEEVRRYEQFSEHANCLRFYKAWEEDDRLYMQMELCRESLERYAERSFPAKISEEKIWSILLDLLLALKSLHDRNLIHLDIKLDNVLIADDDSCKLADFGLVIDVDRANREQATEGDSRYMAPEIMQGNFSTAADIFSLGIAMLELSCYLKLPSNGPLWQQLRSGQLPKDFMRSISPELCAVITQMMTPNPIERPSVNSLLTHQKLIAMIKHRKHWSSVRKLQRTWRRTISSLKSLTHAFKGVVLRFMSSLRYKLNLTFPKVIKPELVVPVIQCTPKQSPACSVTATPFITKYNFRLACETPAYQSTPINSIENTPVNYNHHNIRSRKDLTKTSFKQEGSPERDSSGDLSNRLYFNDFESSSLCGKRLFVCDNADEYD